MKTMCNGKINTNGRCDKCYQVAQSTSMQCNRLVEVYNSTPQTANFMQSVDLTDEEWLKLPKEEILQLYKNCYSLLQDSYRNQKSQSVITDREIEEVFEYYHPTIDEDEKRICLKVAKWAIDRLNTDKRELLVEFNSFMCGNQYDGKIPLIDQCIDDFLSKQPKK